MFELRERNQDTVSLISKLSRLRGDWAKWNKCQFRKLEDSVTELKNRKQCFYSNVQFEASVKGEQHLAEEVDEWLYKIMKSAIF